MTRYFASVPDNALYRVDTYEREDWFDGTILTDEIHTEVDIEEFLRHVDLEDWELELDHLGYDVQALWADIENDRPDTKKTEDAA